VNYKRSRCLADVNLSLYSTSGDLVVYHRWQSCTVSVVNVAVCHRLYPDMFWLKQKALHK